MAGLLHVLTLRTLLSPRTGSRRDDSLGKSTRNKSILMPSAKDFGSARPWCCLPCKGDQNLSAALRKLPERAERCHRCIVQVTNRFSPCLLRVKSSQRAYRSSPKASKPRSCTLTWGHSTLDSSPAPTRHFEMSLSYRRGRIKMCFLLQRAGRFCPIQFWDRAGALVSCS